MFERFLSALPVAATSGYAFVAYVLTLVASTYLASRQRRLGLLLAKLKELPPSDRLSAIRLEMGEIEIPAQFTPEHYLAVKRMRYRFATLIVFLICLVVVFSLAIADSGSVAAVVDLAPGN